MNAYELSQNSLLTPSTSLIHDLNLSPTIPLPPSTFDVALMQLTVDYLTKPVDVFKSISDVIKPGEAGVSGT